MSTSEGSPWPTSTLFSVLRVGSIELRNRFVMPPMKTNMDLLSDQARAYYGRRAEGGVGLVIVEGTALPQFMGLGYPEGLCPLVDAIHGGGASAVIQLFHTGWVDADRVEPSATDEARAAHEEELDRIPHEFARAAVTAREAGFDGVEIHGAHGFFLNRFFSPEHNRRQDRYGGSLESRMRLGLECARAVRAALPADALLLYRHTPQADYPIEDTLAFAPRLEEAGVNILDISPSAAEGGEQASLAGAVKSRVQCPVIAVGGMEDPEAAERVLEAGKADLVAVGRALIADPDFPRKILENRGDEITFCIKCNEKCFGNLSAGIPIACAENPDAGNEYRL
jgi:2,4-dienoyl-CoA reductase-like NADH-dependent reductase (Old Yellow Enzyme family)